MMSWNVNFYRNESLTSENFNGVNRGLLNRGIYHNDISWGGSSADGYRMSFNKGLVAVFQANEVTTKAVLETDTTVQLGNSLSVGDKVCIGYINDTSEPTIRLNILSTEGYSDILDVAVWTGSRFSSNGYDTYEYGMVGGDAVHSHYSPVTGKFTSVGEAYLADNDYTVNGDGLYGYNGTGFGKATVDLSANFDLGYLETSKTNLNLLLAKACGSTFLGAVPSGFYPMLYVEDGVGVLFSDLRSKLGADWSFSYSPVKDVNGTLMFGDLQLLTLGGSDTTEFTAQVSASLRKLVRTASVTVGTSVVGDVDVTLDTTLGVTSSTIAVASPTVDDMTKSVACGVYLKGVSSNKVTFSVAKSSTGSVGFNVVLIN